MELNPEAHDKKKSTWKEYALVEENTVNHFLREMTWGKFNSDANRVADMLFSRGIKKGNKVGILLMNCLEWLPVYFGILKTGALAVPLNFRYTSEEIAYCLDLAEVDLLIFGPEFIGRVEKIVDDIRQKLNSFLSAETSAPLLPKILKNK